MRPGATRAEAGFTIVEALVATALVVLAAFTGLAAAQSAAHAMAWTSGGTRDAAAVDFQTAQLRGDAASAFAVFVPAGRSNELDFYSKTDAGDALYWRYRYDPAKQTLQRSDFNASGAAGVRDVRTGTIDPNAAYPALTGITRFAVREIHADELGGGANVYGGIGALFAGVPRAVSVRYDAPGPNGTGAVGGNGIVAIELATASAARSIHLAAGAMPTGFTVTGAPVWHAVIYRVDQTHRFGFGFAGKSHVFIRARVDVSFDRWQTPGQRRTWCDFNLYGDPDGLDAHDPHADYQPGDPAEQSDAILAACRAITPTPPTVDSTPAPVSGHAPTDDPTPPPCWQHPGPGGRCWPADAPPDWIPPTPFPLDTPPPAWCSAHAASPVCGPRSATRPNRK